MPDTSGLASFDQAMREVILAAAVTDVSLAGIFHIPLDIGSPPSSCCL
jgi:hypothetical protein